MYPKYHIFLGLIFSVVLFYYFDLTVLQASVIFLSSFLIDVDHYLGYVFIKKDLNPFNSVRWHYKNARKFNSLPRSKKNNVYSMFCFLHGIEVLLIPVVLGFLFHKIFYFICLGFLFHLILDVSYEIFIFDRLDKISLIRDFFKYKKLTNIEDVK